MFIPLGISLGIITKSQHRSYPSIIIVSCLISALASTAVEFTQIFLPSRVSNLSDIICNSLGGFLGTTLYYWHSSVSKFVVGLLTADCRKLSLQSLLIAIASYCSLILLATWLFLVSVSLSNWDDSYYLALGNEVTGDRPWNGDINGLYICDRGLNQSEIVAAFKQSDIFFGQFPSLIASLESFNNQNTDLNHSQEIPHLSWHSTSSTLQINRVNPPHNQQKNRHQVDQAPGVSFNQKQWLKSEQPVKSLIHKLKDSEEFSLFFEIASRKIDQTGPARIMTLSDGIYAHNLVLGQEQENLHFRLRTPMTGKLPVKPELMIPDVFDSAAFRQILIIFAHQKLTFYIQNISNEYSFEFTPAYSIISYIPWRKTNRIVNLKNYDSTKHQSFLNLIIMIPLIILVLMLIYYLIFSYRAS